MKEFESCLVEFWIDLEVWWYEKRKKWEDLGKTHLADFLLPSLI
jgi:hypothetical protein